MQEKAIVFFLNRLYLIIKIFRIDSFIRDLIL